jgi:pyruvate-ferredoxin/flavodoxin oxidoreductase
MFRYNPSLVAEGKNPFILDSKEPTVELDKYIYNETRYTMLRQSNPKAAAELLKEAQADVTTRWKMYEYLSKMPGGDLQQALAAAMRSQNEPAPAAKGAANND